MPAEAFARSLAPRETLPLTPAEIVRLGRETLQSEARAILRIVPRLGGNFYRAAAMLFQLRGSVIVTGAGKAGLIGRKIAATLASTGTRARFLHPADAVHGDLGRIGPRDVVVVLSYSGETAEITQILPAVANRAIPVIAITESKHSTLGRAAAIVLELGPIPEACLLGLAPTSSTAAMLAVGDAVALVASRLRGFQPDDFARFHPGGSLGRRLSRVDDHMRPLAACRVAPASETVRQVLVACGKPGRRSGAIMLTDKHGLIAGLFTDSDLARLFEQHRETALDDQIAHVMTASPCTIPSGTLLEDALAEMTQRKISELPVVDADRRPVGMLDVTDVVGAAVHLTQPEKKERPPADAVPNIRIFPNPNEAQPKSH